MTEQPFGENGALEALWTITLDARFESEHLSADGVQDSSRVGQALQGSLLCMKRFPEGPAHRPLGAGADPGPDHCQQTTVPQASSRVDPENSDPVNN